MNIVNRLPLKMLRLLKTLKKTLNNIHYNYYPEKKKKKNTQTNIR